VDDKFIGSTPSSMRLAAGDVSFSYLCAWAPHGDTIRRRAQATAINISTRGVYFATDVVLGVGEAVEVLLEMPKRVTGMKEGIRRLSDESRTSSQII